jgi:hypothetical protein
MSLGLTRRQLLYTIALVSWAAMTVYGQTMDPTHAYSSNVRINATSSPKDFAPDGDLNKDVWQKAEWIRFDHDMAGLHNYPQADTQVAAAWTASYVYFAFKCKYTELYVYEGEDPSKERWELWLRDVAEVFLNPEPERVNHYYEFEVAPNNQWIDLEIDKTKTPFNDAAWDSHFEHAARVDSKGHMWTCEMRIPASSMGVRSVQAGMEWRVNFYRMDGAGDFPQRRLMSWSTIPEGNTFHVPTRFGIIKFLK